MSHGNSTSTISMLETGLLINPVHMGLLQTYYTIQKEINLYKVLMIEMLDFILADGPKKQLRVERYF